MLVKIGADLRLTRPMSQHWVPGSFFWVGALQINFHIFRGLSISKSSLHISQRWGIRQKDFWKEIFRSTEKKNSHSLWQVGYFKCRRFYHQHYFFLNVNWTHGAGFAIVLNPLSSPYEILCRFQFHNLWHAWSRQHCLFRIWHFPLFTVVMELQTPRRM